MQVQMSSFKFKHGSSCSNDHLRGGEGATDSMKEKRRRQMTCTCAIVTQYSSTSILASETVAVIILCNFHKLHD